MILYMWHLLRKKAMQFGYIRELILQRDYTPWRIVTGAQLWILDVEQLKKVFLLICTRVKVFLSNNLPRKLDKNGVYLGALSLHMGTYSPDFLLVVIVYFEYHLFIVFQVSLSLQLLHFIKYCQLSNFVVKSHSMS